MRNVSVLGRFGLLFNDADCQINQGRRPRYPYRVVEAYSSFVASGIPIRRVAETLLGRFVAEAKKTPASIWSLNAKTVMEAMTRLGRGVRLYLILGNQFVRELKPFVDELGALVRL